MVIQILIPWGLVLLFLHLTLAEPFRLKARAVNDGVTDLSRRSRPFHPSAQQRSHSTPGSNEDFELLDTVLVASVDGKFHALNRTNGHIQWSMPDDPISSTDTPLLQHLVRTDHGSLAQPDIHSDPSDIDETYVIEPQTGDIFVLPSTSTPDTTPLQRLTYSMPQLVELSPFRFATDDQRVFVGRKETSMITLDLDTGRVISVFNSDKCFWPESENAQESNNSEYVLDEEELYMLNRPPSTGVREVHIGRTDYHVAVHVRGRGVIQNLAFSAYGPNNIDRDNQLDWTDTPDSRYLQPLPDGTVLSFDFKRERDPLRWSNQFIHPM
jgi:serine/threonine-protein kinase/endoribonuclease IRE1